MRIKGVFPNAAQWGIRRYIQISNPFGESSSPLTFAEDIGSAWNTNINPLLGMDVVTQEIDVVDLSSESGLSGTADVDYTGGSAYGPFDNQIAVVIKDEIARRYRGGKPKTFLPGHNNGVQADGSHITSDAASALGTAWTAFNTAIAAISVVEGGTTITCNGMVNVSMYEGFTAIENTITGRWRNVPKYRTTPLVDLIESFTVDTLLGSQRRRRIG